MGKFYFIKIVIFIFGGIVIGGVLQHILIPKWYYPDTNLEGATSRILTGFYQEENESLDVLMVGTSHMLYGVSPMEMYESYGIKAYNLGTCVQSLPLSYYVIKESLKTQKPQVVVLDVSALWYDNYNNNREIWWRYVLDQMPTSIIENK